MSEEQKNAINELKSMREYFEFQPEGCNWRLSFNEEEVHTIIDVIINLIEKQQKEIEELKKPKFIINAETGEVTKIHNDFINKDKIKHTLLKFQNEYGEWLEITGRLFIGKEVVQYGEDMIDEIAKELDIKLLEE